MNLGNNRSYTVGHSTPQLFKLLFMFYLYTQPIKESTIAFPIRLCHIFTTKVTVKHVSNMPLKQAIMTIPRTSSLQEDTSMGEALVDS